MSILTEFTESGGKIAEDGTVIGVVSLCRWGMNDFKGQQAPKPGLYVMATDPDSGEKLSPFEHEFLGCGNAQDWAPSQDGKSIQYTGHGNARFNGNTGVAVLFKSIAEAGMPTEKLDTMAEDISKLIGWKLKFDRVAKKGSGDIKDFTQLIVTEVLGQGEAAAASKTESPGTGAGNDTMVDWAVDVTMEILANHPDGISKKDLMAQLLPRAMKDKKPVKDVPQIVNDDFLSSGFDFDGTTIKMLS